MTLQMNKLYHAADCKRRQLDDLCLSSYDTGRFNI